MTVVYPFDGSNLNKKETTDPPCHCTLFLPSTTQTYTDAEKRHSRKLHPVGFEVSPPLSNSSGFSPLYRFILTFLSVDGRRSRNKIFSCRSNGFLRTSSFGPSQRKRRTSSFEKSNFSVLPRGPYSLQLTSTEKIFVETSPRDLWLRPTFGGFFMTRRSEH